MCHSLLRLFKIMSQSNMSTLKMSHSSVSICKSVTVYRVHFGKCHSLSCPSKKMSQSILSSLENVTLYCVHLRKCYSLSCPLWKCYTLSCPHWKCYTLSCPLQKMLQSIVSISKKCHSLIWSPYRYKDSLYLLIKEIKMVLQSLQCKLLCFDGKSNKEKFAILFG